MCGRFAFYDIQKFYSRFNIKNRLKDLLPHYNIAPGYNFPVVIRENNENIAAVMKWGLVPFWADDPKIGFRMINARSESLSSKPSFKKPLKSQRCLVPANGFYEWRREDGKIPYFFSRIDNDIFAMAGLYDMWKDAAGRDLRTFTIITVDSSTLAAKIHNRMPAILGKENENIWLDSKTDIKKAIKILKPYKKNDLEMHQVSKRVNKPINDNKELIKPIIK